MSDIKGNKRPPIGTTVKKEKSPSLSEWEIKRVYRNEFYTIDSPEYFGKEIQKSIVNHKKNGEGIHKK